MLSIPLSSSSRVFPHPRHPGILSPCHPERSEGSFSVPASSCRGNRSFVAAAPQDDRGEALLRLRGLPLSYCTLFAACLSGHFSPLSWRSPIFVIPGIPPSSSSRAFSLLVILSAAKDLFPSQPPAAGETDPSSLPLLRMTGGRHSSDFGDCCRIVPGDRSRGAARWEGEGWALLQRAKKAAPAPGQLAGRAGDGRPPGGPGRRSAGRMRASGPADKTKPAASLQEAAGSLLDQTSGEIRYRTASEPLCAAQPGRRDGRWRSAARSAP